MFERIDYIVKRIDGEYAYLQKLEDENAEEKCVAMALLPSEIMEGSRVAYEMMEYRIV
ncbi:MAG: chorismate--pyruvate lyase [Eubacteriales bacterium]|nr:chorismate--pyruvate lyase [Eubacteriales bacterium]